MPDCFQKITFQSLMKMLLKGAVVHIAHELSDTNVVSETLSTKEGCGGVGGLKFFLQRLPKKIGAICSK